MSFTYIETDAEFAALCRSAATHERIAFDTEFVRETTYYPRFCLLQIGLTDEVYCIDPTRLSVLEPLQQLLGSPKPTFIAHAARQDLELLYLKTKQLPNKLLDTQLGAGLSGLPDQVGYASLVHSLLDRHLSKEQTRTDWQQRPLSKAQLDYAADDVRFLIPVADQLHAALESKGRLAWWEEDSARLLDKGLLEPDRSKAWQRLQGVYALDETAGSRAIAIATWREEVAMALDLPRSWVLRDDALLNWARQSSIAADAAPMRIKNTSLQRSHIDQLRARLETASLDAEREAFAAHHQPPPDERRKHLLKGLTESVRTTALALGLSAPLLASRRDLEGLIDHPERSRLLSGWRHSAIGSQLAHQIAGTASSSINRWSA